MSTERLLFAVRQVKVVEVTCEVEATSEAVLALTLDDVAT